MPQKTQKNNSQKTEVGSIAENFGENLRVFLEKKYLLYTKIFKPKTLFEKQKSR